MAGIGVKDTWWETLWAACKSGSLINSAWAMDVGGNFLSLKLEWAMFDH